MICKNRNEKEKNEIYQVLGALCKREKVQIEDQINQVVIYVCPQGKIYVTEGENSITIQADTRHAGAGFHAFVVEFCKALRQEIPGEYELKDDLGFVKDGNFRELYEIYLNELTYMKDLLLKNPDVREMNYLYDETYFLPIVKEEMIPTPKGYLNIHDFEMMTESELMDSFFVWNNWDKDARYYKNAALLTLAKEGVGPYATMNENTIKHAHEICDYIELANSLDPDLPLPVDAYNTLSQQLGREKMLKDPIPMEEDVWQYRNADVYHLFDDVRVVAHGASERSFDRVRKALCLMGPYQQDHEWNWLFMASKEPGICEHIDEVLEQEPIEKEDKKVYLDHWQQDGIYIVEGIVQQDLRTLYMHAVVAEKKDVPYIEACMEQSGFTKQA